MEAIEFIAQADDGVIKIPKKHINHLDKKFRVIILIENKKKIETKQAKKRTFKAIRIDTKKLKFNRDEANERR